MKYPEHRKLFTVKDVTRTCGVSRTTLIRLEESGILTPYRIDPETGYRYYDMQGVAAVGQYQRMQSMGLSRAEIADVYLGRVDSAEFLAQQRRRLEATRRFLDEYEMRHDRSRDRLLSYTTLPAVTYYCVDFCASSFEECATLSYTAHEKCMSAGYRLLGSEPGAMMVDDWLALSDAFPPGLRVTACFPIVPGPEANADPSLRSFPETRALSVLGFGNYSAVPKLWQQLYAGLDAAGLAPTGPARLIALVAPYVGAHIRPDEFCYECVVPIGSDS